jgi:hypothetical protein
MTTAIRHPERKVASAILEGVEYKAHPDTGVLEVHDAHLQAARALGFKTMDELHREAVEVKTEAEAPKDGDDAPVQKDEFDGMGFDDLGKWLLESGMEVDPIRLLRSKKDRAEAARARKVELAKKSDPLES